MDEVEHMATQLERMMGDPIADSVQGFVRVVSVSAVPRRGVGYFACQLELMTESADVAPTLVSTEVVTRRKWWPGRSAPAGSHCEVAAVAHGRELGRPRPLTAESHFATVAPR